MHQRSNLRVLVVFETGQELTVNHRLIFLRWYMGVD